MLNNIAFIVNIFISINKESICIINELNVNVLNIFFKYHLISTDPHWPLTICYKIQSYMRHQNLQLQLVNITVITAQLHPFIIINLLLREVWLIMFYICNRLNTYIYRFFYRCFILISFTTLVNIEKFSNVLLIVFGQTKSANYQ